MSLQKDRVPLRFAYRLLGAVGSLSHERYYSTDRKNRLEATFGVIAAAAPSVRPLFGRISPTKTNSRYNQYNHSRSLPLDAIAPGHGSRYSVGGGGSRIRDAQKLEDGDMQWDDESAESKFWARSNSGIVKRVEVSVSRTLPTSNPKGGTPNRSSEELLVMTN